MGCFFSRERVVVEDLLTGLSRFDPVVVLVLSTLVYTIKRTPVREKF
jgi:hypothetical protein